LIDRIKQGPLTSSDFRQMTVQVLVAFFEAEADIDGQTNKAFAYCRGLRPIKQDVPYFEGHLAPLLFREAAMNGNSRLAEFFLGELARFLNLYGKPIDPNITPEQFGQFDEPLKVLQLQRRRTQLGTDLLADRGSLEFHLSRVDGFAKMAGKGSLTEYLLREWDYTTEEGFWSKFKAFLAEAAGRGMGAVGSWRYMRLLFSQRKPALFLYGFLMVLFVVLAIWVPMSWMDRSQQELDNLEQRVSDRRSLLEE